MSKQYKRMLGHAPASMTLDTDADLFDGVVARLHNRADASSIGDMWALLGF